MPIHIAEEAGAIAFEVRVKPKAPRSGFAGVRDGVLEIKLAAPPVDGAANDELIAFLSEALDVPKRAVRILRGERARHKRLRVEGITGPELLQRCGVGS